MHLVSASDIEALSERLPTGRGLRVATITVDFDPFDFARTGASLVDRAVAYSMPNGDRLVGLGTAWHASAEGPGRFERLAERITGLEAPDVMAFLGYSFLDRMPPGGLWKDFRAAEAFVPRIAIRRMEGRSTLSVAIPEGERPGPTIELLASMRRPEWLPVVDFGDHTIESHPPVAEWAHLVADAVKAIDAGEFEKVVLARTVKVHSSEEVAILRAFRQLVMAYPLCYTFAWKSGESVFMGASPELLAEVHGAAFRSNPLAGSAARGEGDDDDTALGVALMASAKDQEEHRLVVEDMRTRLSGLVDDLVIPQRPALKKMATVQHLSTEISGSVPDATSVLDVVGAVHPTPAVGGVPRQAAVDYITDREPIDRGWYTGGVGWMTPTGDGAVAIALRCGLIERDTTTLFAGAGIVADSDPAAELVETRLKLRPLLDLVAST
jgi:isochorismate synthase